MSKDEPPPFQIRLRSQRVQRELDGLPEEDYTQVSARLKLLAGDPKPPGSKKLTGDIYRIRVGNLRVIYLVDTTNRRIEVGAVHRRTKSTYKGITDLFQY